MINLPKAKLFIIVVIFLLLLAALLASRMGYGFRSSPEKSYPEYSTGLERVSCWFKADFNWPKSECYYMHVPEDHSHPEGRTISFPVLIFRSNALVQKKSPLLHLGGGGPGGPMYLDFKFSVQTHLDYLNDMSIRQGRDLYIIDPRGTGLSRPLLSCDSYVKNERQRLTKNLAIRKELALADQDYFDCIKRFQAADIDLSQYNTLAVAHDVEALRKAANIERWVLFGVSYSATYAQFIAAEYPSSIESMILDSIKFINLKMHHNFIDQTMASYHAMFSYCDISPNCKRPINNIEQRIDKLYTELNKKPAVVPALDYNSGQTINVVLNGGRFVNTLLNNVYGLSLFSDLPKIVTELEAGEHATIVPYVENYIAFLLDATYGDVSSAAHYCFEDKAYTDFDIIRSKIPLLPEGHIRDQAELFLDWPDYCSAMQVEPGPVKMAAKTQTDIPTLFLHGEFDTVTRLADVKSQLNGFNNARLKIYPSSHAVLGSDECAEFVAAKFVANYRIKQGELTCQRR